MFRALLALCVLSIPAFAQPYPSYHGAATTAKPARVSLTADGTWLPTPVPPKTHLAIYEDTGTHPRMGDGISGARLLLYVDRDALQRVTVDAAFVQPSVKAAPGADPYRSVGFV